MQLEPVSAVQPDLPSLVLAHLMQIARTWPPRRAQHPLVTLLQQFETDADGWTRASQRALAKAAGWPLSRLARELKAAALAGVVQIDTSGRTTAVRVLNA